MPSPQDDAFRYEILIAVTYGDAGSLDRLFDYLRLLEFDDAAIDRVAEAVHLRDAFSPYRDVQRKNLLQIVEREWQDVLAGAEREAFEGLFGRKDR